MQLSIPLVLASSSSSRLQLLRQIGIEPSLICSPDIDETPLRGEIPRVYNVRVTRMKAAAIHITHSDKLVLAADTIASKGRRILQKPKDIDEARSNMLLMSGARHRVYTAVHLFAPGGVVSTSQVMTYVKFKTLHKDEIDFYLSTNEWSGAAGGYMLSGIAAMFVEWVGGSPSAVSGLPLCQTYKMLHNYLVDK